MMILMLFAMVPLTPESNGPRTAPTFLALDVRGG